MKNTHIKKQKHLGKALRSAMQLLRTRRPRVVSEYRGNGQGCCPWRPTARGKSHLRHLLWYVHSCPYASHLENRDDNNSIYLMGVLGGLNESILHRMTPSTE